MAEESNDASSYGSPKLEVSETSRPSFEEEKYTTAESTIDMGMFRISHDVCHTRPSPLRGKIFPMHLLLLNLLNLLSFLSLSSLSRPG